MSEPENVLKTNKNILKYSPSAFPLLRWDYLYAMAAAIKNMD
jgi:hypothetical protein